MRRIFLTLLMICFGLVAQAEDDVAMLDFGSDAFRAGTSVLHDAAGTDDLFMAGETVRATADIAGSAHMAGRRVTMQGAVGGDAYMAGADVVLNGPVAGDASLAGYAVQAGAVGGDLRITGAKLSLTGPVAGYAMVAGEDVEFDAVVSRDVMLAAKTVDFGDNARVEGQLIIYEENPGDLRVPERVAPEARIERRKIEDWDGDFRPFNWRRMIGKFLIGVLVVAGIAALIAALVPQQLAAMRRLILDRPFHTLWIGFLTQSAVVGSAILFAMTVVGLFLTPAAILLALLGGFAGYVVAVYAFGVGLLLAFGKPEPDSIAARALAAGIGALVVGLIVLIPLLGWIFMLALVLAGVGAITMRVFRPGFFGTPV